MQSKTIIDLLSNETSIRFIADHLKDDVKKLAMEANKYAGLDIKSIASLILLYQKAEIKLPEHLKKLAAFNAKSYEQCTGESMANLKAQLMNLKGKRLINITGGIGIDDWAMCNFAQFIDSCEIDHEINELAKFNVKLFQNTNINRHLVDGIEFVRKAEFVDCIYADPDRRPNASKVFRLEDSAPDIIKNMELLLEKANEVWIKISPMADISYLEKAITSIQKIYVLAIHNEVKEIFVCCTKDFLGTKKVSSINISQTQTEIFEKSFNNPKTQFNNDGTYLYEPNRAIIKAGLSAEYSHSLGLKMLSINSHFFISPQLKLDFYGRTFKIIKRLAYKPKAIAEYLKLNAIVKANITCRNFRESPEDLKKRFKLKDGGENYLCFTTDFEDTTWLYHCKKIE